ncbi:MAG: prepilin-type N-terminal cleavage/methylation domain-containing protein [Longimicrobiales bacterium]
MSPREERRRGYTLVELLVVLLASTLVVSALAAMLWVQARELGVGLDRATARETVRAAALVLPAEARWLDPAAEMTPYVPDSLRIRAYRAVAIPCRVESSGDVLARVTGLRDIEPNKDSALWLGDGGAERALAVVSAVPLAGSVSGCPLGPREELVRLRVSPDTPATGLLMMFERGSYHLTDGALRYRRDAGGRQPLTVEWLSPQSGFRAAGGRVGDVVAEVVVDGPGPRISRRARIRLRGWNGEAAAGCACGPACTCPLPP